MTEQTDLTSLISAAVAARMTPEFVEREVNSRVERLIVESVDKALRTWSDTGKLIEAAIMEALKVDNLDLPSYGHVVAGLLKSQIESRVSDLVAGQLAKDMDELLHLAPKEVRLSEIAEEMLERRDDGYGEVITVIVEHTEYGSAWVYLDEDQVIDRHRTHQAQFRLYVGKDGKISGACIGGRDMKSGSHIGHAYGLEQKIRAWVACGTTLVLDEDCVRTSKGDY